MIFRRQTKTASVVTGAVDDGLALATFAGGCFWCMEPPFDELPGARCDSDSGTSNPCTRANRSDHALADRIRHSPPHSPNVERGGITGAPRIRRATQQALMLGMPMLRSRTT
jgi:hypothetical protein